MSRSNLRPQSLQTRITHLIQHWPKDAVRPPSVSVQNYLQSCLPQSASPATSKTATKAKSTSQSTAKQKISISESSVKALESLLADRYSKKHPFPKSLRHPASDPDHYDKLLREFEEAPNRSWFGRLMKRLSGAIRLK